MFLLPEISSNVIKVESLIGLNETLLVSGSIHFVLPCPGGIIYFKNGSVKNIVKLPDNNLKAKSSLLVILTF